MLWLCWDVKMGFKKRYLMVFEQYKNARGCHWQCVGQGGSGSSRVFLGKLSPFTTTNSNVDLGCIFQALFVGTVCSCYSLWLTTTIIVVVGTHMGLGSLVPPKGSSQRTTRAFVNMRPFLAYYFACWSKCGQCSEINPDTLYDVPSSTCP